MSVSDAQKLKTLEDENRRLKKLLAESMLDVSALKDLLGVRRQKFWDRRALDLEEDWPRLGLVSRRRSCGAASADVRGSVA